MSKQHPVFVEDKQKAPTQPKPDTLQPSPAQEGDWGRIKIEDRRSAAGARQVGRVTRVRQTSRLWTEADNEQLKALAAAGASSIRAAAKFKRSAASVKTQARKLRVSFVPYRIARKKWSEPLAKNAQDPRS
jgi:hypothetical protein